MTTHIRTLFACTLVLALALLGACAEDPVHPTAPTAFEEGGALTVATVEAADYTSYAGVIGGSNQYEIRVPADWNGELVLYAHGFVDSFEPLDLPKKDNVAAIRDEITSMGFAFAYCSFRENGLALKDGAWSTRQVHQIFRSKVKSEPVYTWLMGHSLGGLVAVNLAERHPGEYDGVVTLAGLVGGTKAEIDYMGDVRVLFDLFYPGVLPGSVIEPAAIVDPYNEVIVPVVTAVTADPDGLGVISRTLPLPGTTPDELVESLITAIMFNYRGLSDMLERTNGACPYDNTGRLYTERWPGALPPGVLDMVNAAVPRYSRSLPTEELFARYYEPSGRLGIEMIAVHLAHDPIVPAFHEDLYAEKVAATGNAHRLERRILDGVGHTLELDLNDVLQALTDLRDRVVPGVAVVNP